MEMNIVKTRDVKDPKRGHSTDAGIDLFVPEDFESQEIKPGESAFIPAGIKADVPANHALIAFNKSGVAAKKKLVVGACVIDETYTGEIHIDIKNVGTESQTINPGDKIIQLLCVPLVYPAVKIVETEEECFGDKLETSERGAGGFGSTGTK